MSRPAVPDPEDISAADAAELAQLESDIAEAADEFDDSFTPIQDVIAIARTSSERELAIAFWKHSANQELRFRRSRNRSAEAAMRRDINACSRAIIDIRGEKGDNGKLGELKRRVDGHDKKSWGLITLLLGGVGAAAAKLVMVGQLYGELRADVTATQKQLSLLQAENQMLRAVLIVPRPDNGKDPAP